MDINRQRAKIWDRIYKDFQYPDCDDYGEVVELVRFPAPGEASVAIGSHDDFWERRGIEVQPGDWSANDHEGSAALYRFEGDRIVCVASEG